MKMKLENDISEKNIEMIKQLLLKKDFNGLAEIIMRESN